MLKQNITSINLFFVCRLCLQPFERYVETGRVAKATSGPLRGKLITIVDVIDQTRVSNHSLMN